MAQYNNATTNPFLPAVGDIVDLSFFANGELVSPHLWRTMVAGHPEYNQMLTSIDMTGNNLNNVGDIYLSSINRRAVQGVYDGFAVANAAFVNKPTCPMGLSPYVYGGASSFSDSGTGLPVSAVQVYATNASATQWQVFMRVLTQNGWSNPPPATGIISGFTKCA